MTVDSSSLPLKTSWLSRMDFGDVFVDDDREIDVDIWPQQLVPQKFDMGLSAGATFNFKYGSYSYADTHDDVDFNQSPITDSSGYERNILGSASTDRYAYLMYERTEDPTPPYSVVIERYDLLNKTTYSINVGVSEASSSITASFVACTDDYVVFAKQYLDSGVRGIRLYVIAHSEWETELADNTIDIFTNPLSNDLYLYGLDIANNMIAITLREDLATDNYYVAGLYIPDLATSDTFAPDTSETGNGWVVTTATSAYAFNTCHIMLDTNSPERYYATVCGAANSGVLISMDITYISGTLAIAMGMGRVNSGIDISHGTYSENIGAGTTTGSVYGVVDTSPQEIAKYAMQQCVVNTSSIDVDMSDDIAGTLTDFRITLQFVPQEDLADGDDIYLFRVGEAELSVHQDDTVGGTGKLSIYDGGTTLATTDSAVSFDEGAYYDVVITRQGGTWSMTINGADEAISTDNAGAVELSTSADNFTLGEGSDVNTYIAWSYAELATPVSTWGGYIYQSLIAFNPAKDALSSEFTFDTDYLTLGYFEETAAVTLDANVEVNHMQEYNNLLYCVGDKTGDVHTGGLVVYAYETDLSEVNDTLDWLFPDDATAEVGSARYVACTDNALLLGCSAEIDSTYYVTLSQVSYDFDSPFYQLRKTFSITTDLSSTGKVTDGLYVEELDDTTKTTILNLRAYGYSAPTVDAPYALAMLTDTHFKDLYRYKETPDTRTINTYRRYIDSDAGATRYDYNPQTAAFDSAADGAWVADTEVVPIQNTANTLEAYVDTINLFYDPRTNTTEEELIKALIKLGVCDMRGKIKSTFDTNFNFPTNSYDIASLGEEAETAHLDASDASNSTGYVLGSKQIEVKKIEFQTRTARAVKLRIEAVTKIGDETLDRYDDFRVFHINILPNRLISVGDSDASVS